jgi:hypothetical protein
MSGYVLGYAGFTLLGGRAADLLGRVTTPIMSSACRCGRAAPVHERYF